MRSPHSWRRSSSGCWGFRRTPLRRCDSSSPRWLSSASSAYGIGGVLLAIGQDFQGWARWLALAFTISVVVFGVLLIVQGALETQTLGAALRYQLFSTLPAALLTVFLFRAEVPARPA